MRNPKKSKKIQGLLEITTWAPTVVMMHITTITAIQIHGGIIRVGDSLWAIIPRIYGDILIMIRFGRGGITTIIIPLGTIRRTGIPIIHFRKEHSIVGLPTRNRLPVIGWLVEIQMTG
jgi:hypothetical protein